MPMKLNMWIKHSIFSALLTAEICLFLFVVFRLQNTIKELLLIFSFSIVTYAIINALCCCSHFFSKKKKAVIIIAVPIIFSVVVCSLFLMCDVFTPHELDSGKDSFFCKKKVMIIVPHQDDEVLLAGGIIENYIAADSEVKIVFTTAGDYSGIGDWRMEEAISVAKYYHIDEGNVYFLGYGNEWNGDYHIYNAPEKQIMLSVNQMNRTYALPEHPAFHDGKYYTRENFKNDIKAVLSENQPDVIYCVDYDAHADHRATSLLFDEAMGELLKEYDGAYQPIVFKGFAYSCSLKAAKDYCSTINPSTKCPSDNPFMVETNVYNWENRVRIPVSSSSIADRIENTHIYRALELYKSQNVLESACAVVNGDRVFWERNTSSLLYNASITVIDGNASLLTDFKIYDSRNIRDFDSIPSDGVWIPKKAESPEIDVSFSDPVELTSIVVYDNPSLVDNVLAITLSFDDGTRIRSTNILQNGAPSVISFPRKVVGSFYIMIDKSEGERSGFTEIEAFNDQVKDKNHLIKMMDNEENFIYCYYFDQNETDEFSLYSYHAQPLSQDNYVIVSDNRKINASIDGDVIRVSCPHNCYGKITLANRDEDFSDTIYVYGKNRIFLHQAAMQIDAWKTNTFNISALKSYVKSILRDLDFI